MKVVLKKNVQLIKIKKIYLLHFYLIYEKIYKEIIELSEKRPSSLFDTTLKFVEKFIKFGKIFQKKLINTPRNTYIYIIN